ncbi:MAG: dynamin family protein [Proteobacteria bacterium]|jgi:GTPase SAR1 family protein|nr:dynamin family protein [Pseudomonadota bacterium]
MFGVDKDVAERLHNLEKHLRDENPLLVKVVRKYRQLDRIAWRTGLLARNQSYAAMIPWWPLISVLGTFSAGKSSFINQYLGRELQETGNQAVDDKFTVICYSSDPQSRNLPGVALDADPRFPFYQFSEELDKVAEGEGDRVDAYLQLKTCNSEQLRGRIIIDSPGFDADSQRTATLRITDHIIDLSDLVLVFFDARHPEPGAMQDTLTHLVGNTIKRHDSSKFLYILNQIDTTSREDNPEDVVGAWQRALAQEGLTAGKFYNIYNQTVANPIDDAALRERYERKCKEDLDEIYTRMEQVRDERAYRITDALEKTARIIDEVRIPQLQQLLSRWLRGTVWRNVFVWLLIMGVLIALSVKAGYWNGLQFYAPWQDLIIETPRRMAVAGLVVFIFVLLVHGLSRHWAARSTLRYLRKTAISDEEAEMLGRAFRKNTRWWRSVFRPNPVGWGRRVHRKLHAIIAAADEHIQSLNDRFTSPSGKGDGSDVMQVAAETEVKTEVKDTPTTEPDALPTESRDPDVTDSANESELKH